MTAYADRNLSTLYVRCGATYDECVVFCDILRDVYDAKNFAILNVLMDEKPRGFIDETNSICAYEISNVVNKPHDDYWMGDDVAWQGMLRRFHVKTLSESAIPSEGAA
ncbi:hypothetical protein [Methylobacterium isbiliense]|jgi:hypothetical protein|uniref:hypothetical protein n=1 Tax=Methylobacterium isbiliense TaxID=315478 RepID=UPI001EE3850C|nr:hypothetical protein [Methylobacterium isbiliense]MDN3625786.1 hypothetical protein [Methylobacterium isbiliense]